MARRYDSQTTTFSPEGRLYQVEYAIAAIQNAAAAIGILTQEGIVVVTEKKISSKLLSPAKSSEKIYKIADHCFTAVAGLTSDANILVNHARLAAARYEYTYSEAMPVEGLVQQLSDYVHGYTQSGGLRPFGVAFLYAGWDRHYGYQLYQSDPSGNYSGWKATAIGSNSQSATTNLKADFKEDMSLPDAVTLALKTLTKAMDTTAPTSEKLEVAVLTRDKASGKITQRSYSAQETDEVLKAIAAAAPPAAAVPAP